VKKSDIEERSKEVLFIPHISFSTMVNSVKKSDIEERSKEVLFIPHISDLFEILYVFIAIFVELGLLFVKNYSPNIKTYKNTKTHS
jgi:hypothetical protein